MGHFGIRRLTLIHCRPRKTMISKLVKLVKDEGWGTGATLHFTSPAGDTFAFGVEETTTAALEALIREQCRDE